ncbi:MAG: hypothetical protein ABSD98_04320 [Candidatus Korobacteraceae bacterium]|jgi:hypothetical protein
MAYIYKDALNAAQQELHQAMRMRDQWTLEVARLEQLVKSLAVSANKNRVLQRQPDVVGLQELVLTAVRTASSPTSPMSAADVKAHLLNMGYDLSRYSNPSAVIYGALKRLAKKGGPLIEVDPGRYYARLASIVAEF